MPLPLADVELARLISPCCRLQRDLVAYLQREAKAWEAQARAEGRCSAEEEGEHLPEALLTAAHMGRCKPVRDFLAAGGKVVLAEAYRALVCAA